MLKIWPAVLNQSDEEYMSELKFYWKSTCTTCRKARSFLVDAGSIFHERNYAKNPFTKPELEALFQQFDPSIFINPKSQPFKALGLAEKSLTKEEVIDLVLSEPNLLKRPFVIKDGKVIFGFSEQEYQKLI